MEYSKELKEKLDRLTHEVVELKSMLISQIPVQSSVSEKAWRNLMKDSEEVSVLWKGCSALEEIRAQRGK